MKDITFAQFLNGCSLDNVELRKGKWFKITEPIRAEEIPCIVKFNEVTPDMEIFISGRRCGKTQKSNIKL